jgi:hypothetical protein
MLHSFTKQSASLFSPIFSYTLFLLFWVILFSFISSSLVFSLFSWYILCWSCLYHLPYPIGPSMFWAKNPDINWIFPYSFSRKRGKESSHVPVLATQPSYTVHALCNLIPRPGAHTHTQMGAFRGTPPPSCPSSGHCAEWARTYLKYCLCSTRDDVALGLGLASVLSWAVAEVPQIITNYKQKSTEGLSIAFLMTWIVGYAVS